MPHTSIPSSIDWIAYGPYPPIPVDATPSVAEPALIGSDEVPGVRPIRRDMSHEQTITNRYLLQQEQRKEKYLKARTIGSMDIRAKFPAIWRAVGEGRVRFPVMYYYAKESKNKRCEYDNNRFANIRFTYSIVKYNRGRRDIKRYSKYYNIESLFKHQLDALIAAQRETMFNIAELNNTQKERLKESRFRIQSLTPESPSEVSATYSNITEDSVFSTISSILTNRDVEEFDF